MIPFREAQQIIKSLARSFGTEKVILDEALGRTLAEPVFADRDYPPFDRATMDGIAINVEDFNKGWRIFSVVETIYAGQQSRVSLSTGQCYKIMTGAAVPVSANAVIRREDIKEDGGLAIVTVEGCNTFQNIATKGQDLRGGSEVLKSGQICTPVILSLLASLGKAEVLVKKLPSVFVVTTGNEIVRVGEEVSDVQIRNSNSHLLRALLRQNQITNPEIKHVRDEKAELFKVLQSGLNSDILIINGGVSAGDADYVPEILESLGVNKLFHKVAIRPGKPIWCGEMSSGGMVFALPGNPYSCMATFTLFIQPYLNYCLGRESQPVEPVSLMTSRRKRVSLDEFFPVKLTGSPSAAEALEINGSGDIRLGLNATALALHPADSGDLKGGDKVECYLL